jgi:hypothetical protein
MDDNKPDGWDDLPEALRDRFDEHIELLDFEAERRVQEHLDSLDSMMDRGWTTIFGGAFDDREGPTLDQVKEAASRNREMSLNPHIGGGCELIHSYVWNTPIRYSGIPRERRGRGETVWDRIHDPVNQKNFFGPLARKQRQAGFYYDGNVMFIGHDDGTFQIEAVSIKSIEDDYRNPNNGSEIWAYRYCWTEHTLAGFSTTGISTSGPRVPHGTTRASPRRSLTTSACSCATPTPSWAGVTAPLTCSEVSRGPRTIGRPCWTARR